MRIDRLKTTALPYSYFQIADCDSCRVVSYIREVLREIVSKFPHPFSCSDLLEEDAFRLVFRFHLFFKPGRFSPPANEGYVFIGVCLWSRGGGVSASGPGGGSATPSGRHPPPVDTTGYGQQAGGTHPTGMHSRYKFISVKFSL